MLQKLVIKNYAIIDNLLLEPGNGLNTITGETGAGKSIILGALSLILGDRADTSVLINKNEKSVIEGIFDVSNNATFKQALLSCELDYEPTCIIRREIAVSGKSRAFVNDTPVTLQVLNSLTSMLVDLQQQFGHLALEEDGFQVDTLDAVADSLLLAKAHKSKYATWKSRSKELQEKKDLQAKQKQEADYKQYLLDELIEANLSAGELENAEQQLKQLNNAERILNTLHGAQTVLTEGEQPIVNELKRIVQQLQGIVDVYPSIQPLLDRLTSAWVEIKDIADEVEIEQGNVTVNPEAIEMLQQRLDIGYKLLKKHGLNTTDDLRVLRQKLEDELQATVDFDSTIVRLEEETQRLYDDMVVGAANLSAKRKAAIKEFEERIDILLALVGMPNARFKVQLSDTQPSANGADKVQYTIDANRSGQFLPLHKAASGGEMSRIMLCIKSMVAKALHLPTLVFDEVDTGISGEAARQVGMLLRNLSGFHQVICITHQPQVAALGSSHFFVYKDGGSTGVITTKVRLLAKEERVLAIARMIGGEQPTDAALSSARELMAI